MEYQSKRITLDFQVSLSSVSNDYGHISAASRIDNLAGLQNRLVPLHCNWTIIKVVKQT